MKILVLRFSSIGDIVLTTPVVRCLKKQLGAEIHFLSKTAFAPILESNPYIDQVHTFQQEISPALSKHLKSMRYDQVIDLHHNLRSLRLKTALGRPSSSFNKLNLEKWLLVNLGLDWLPQQHIVGRYMETVRHLGVTYDGEGLNYFIPDGTDLGNTNLPSVPFIAFAIGATHATKRLPTAKIAAICQGIEKPVVLLGGKTEMEAGQHITQNSGPHVIDLCGKLSLHQSALVLKQSEKVITHDTGLMHMAAALRKPMVSVWGSTVPKFGMWPFYPTGMDLNTSIETTGLKCRPCSKIGFDQCPKGHFRCMNDLDIEKISKAV